MDTKPKPTIQQLRQVGPVSNDPLGRELVAVKATCQNVLDTGVRHTRGAVFDMEISVAAAHLFAGQVELVAKTTPTKKGK